MRIAHISDTHLGFRAFGRTTPTGFNQREVDVMRTFRTCLEQVRECEPDVIVHSGDFFHVVRPTNATIYHAFKSVADIQAKRNGRPFILIGGNHDTPRMAESGNILHLFAEIPGVDVHTGGAEAFAIDDLDLEVLCVPSNSLLAKETLEWSPQLHRKHSLLTLHGMAKEAISDAAEFEVSQTKPDRWTYVAMGDYHSYQSYAPNVCYAGSTDFTSTNIWEEAATPKGWVLFDTEVGVQEFHRLETRPVIDLPKIDARDLTPEGLTEQIRGNATWDPETEPIVRQRVTNVHMEVRGRIGAGIVRELNARCLNYLLRLLPPEIAGAKPGSPKTESMTLERSWDEHMERAELPKFVQRERVRAVGLELLKEVAEHAADPAEA